MSGTGEQRRAGAAADAPAAPDVPDAPGGPVTDPAPRPRPGAADVARVAARGPILIGHVVVVALAVTTILLGRWQWHVAHVRHGDVQNYAYAVQWWIFCGFGLLMWLRILRDQAAQALERDAHPLPAPQPAAADQPAPADQPAAADQPAPAEQPGRAPVAFRPYAPPTSDEIAGDDPTDPVRSRYNADLARYGRDT